MLTGRDFTWHDDANAPKVAIVNQTFAHSMFGNASAIGQHFMMSDKTAYEIIGVVEDGKYESLTEARWAAMFFSIEQFPDSDMSLVVRSSRPTGELIPQLSAVFAQINPSLPFTIEGWPDALALILFPARVATAALGVMG